MYVIRYRMGFDGKDEWYDPKKYKTMAKAKEQVRRVTTHALLEFLEGEPFIREIAILEAPPNKANFILKHEWVADEIKYEMFF